MSLNIHRLKVWWIATNLLMVVSMIIIGGITRLTDSGLSMTEWNLISGIIPPMNHIDWLDVFGKYQKSPEYLIKNYNMSLVEFKKIFFWEYFHRIWGRLIGLTFILPLTIFWLLDCFSLFEKKFFSLLTLLGCFQGFMGYFMVKSGLVDKPDVSHFRLSAHLIIAFAIYSMLLYFFWNLISRKNTNLITSNYNSQIFCIKTCIFFVFLTIASGAFVSGTNAGWAYNNFPFMGEDFLPPILLRNEFSSLDTLFNDIGFIQFGHRILATVTLFFTIFTVYQSYRSRLFKGYINLISLVLLAVVSQYTLGVITLKYFVPITLGLMHQLGSLILLSLLIISICEIKKRRAFTRPSLS